MFLMYFCVESSQVVFSYLCIINQELLFPLQCWLFSQRRNLVQFDDKKNLWSTKILQ